MLLLPGGICGNTGAPTMESFHKEHSKPGAGHVIIVLAHPRSSERMATEESITRHHLMFSALRFSGHRGSTAEGALILTVACSLSVGSNQMTDELQITQQLPRVKVIGKAGSATAYKIRDYLQRSDVPFEWIELANDEQARAEAGVDNLQDSRLPVCILADGTRMESPTIRQITEKLGWFRDATLSQYDLAIYGAGPAGLSAAVYGASEGLKTVVIERSAVGGQAGTTSKIENYLGFPHGISGADLAERAREQACRFGAEFLLLREGVGGEFLPGKSIGRLADGTKIIARSSICATGVPHRWERQSRPQSSRLCVGTPYARSLRLGCSVRNGRERHDGRGRIQTAYRL